MPKHTARKSKRVSSLIGKEIKAGKPQKQAVAIALSKERKRKKK